MSRLPPWYNLLGVESLIFWSLIHSSPQKIRTLDALGTLTLRANVCCQRTHVV